MSVHKIDKRKLNRLVTIKRKTSSRDSIGGSIDNYTVIYENLLSNVFDLQIVDFELHRYYSGSEVKELRMAFLESIDDVYNEISVVVGDIFVDNSTGTQYEIIAVEKYVNFSGEAHHFELIMENRRRRTYHEDSGGMN